MSAKSAIVFYSRTNHTRKVVEAFAEKTGSETFEWQCTQRYVMPVLWYFRAGFDSLRGIEPDGNEPLPDLSAYRWVLLAGPVWAGRPAAPLRGLIGACRDLPNIAGLLLTSGDPATPTKTFKMCDDALGHAFPVRAHVGNTIEGTPEMNRRLPDLSDALGSARAEAAE